MNKIQRHHERVSPGVAVKVLKTKRNPNGDIDTMNTMYKNLKKDGLLLLGIPVGPDVVAWNAHREYGKIRYPVLISQFIELEWIGWTKDKMISNDCKIGYSDYQPLIILKKN